MQICLCVKLLPFSKSATLFFWRVELKFGQQILWHAVHIGANISNNYRQFRVNYPRENVTRVFLPFTLEKKTKHWQTFLPFNWRVWKTLFNWPPGRGRWGRRWSWRASGRSRRPWRRRAWPTAWTSQWWPRKEWDLHRSRRCGQPQAKQSRHSITSQGLGEDAHVSNKPNKIINIYHYMSGRI